LKIPKSYLRCAELPQCCPLVSCLSNSILLVATPRWIAYVAANWTDFNWT
jgi:hypothetical protein